MRYDAVIVGGGIAGLSVAYELQQRHVRFVLLERAARAGGVILSEEIDGFTIDAGPDSLLVAEARRHPAVRRARARTGARADQAAAARLHPARRAAASAARVLRPRHSHARFGRSSRRVSFPCAAKLRMAAEPFVPRRRDDADESIGGFVTRRFGGEATTYLAEPLLAGIHAGDVNRLSIRALFPRFVDAERTHGSLLRAFRAAPRPASADGAFRSLPGGLSQMIRALTARLPADAFG